MNYYLTMETMTFIAEWESSLLERIRKYFADNKGLITVGLAAMCNSHHANYMYDIMQRK